MDNNIKKVGIFSGKGGVGKTSITASLAIYFAENHKILAVDTDVDAPNLALLFHKDSKPVDSIKVQTTEKASFIPEKCVHCKKCINDVFCNFDALDWNDEQKIPEVDFVSCEGCNACALLCPEHAFDINPVNSGTISHLKTNYAFDVISGETILGSQTSGKLVSELKTYAMKIGEQNETDLLLIDGPPGIGCPVIAALTDLDFVVIVIEPTSAAIHDANRLLEIVKSFEIPHGFIINKADIFLEGKNKIQTYLDQHEVQILGSINLDENWPNSIAEAQPIVIFDPTGSSAKSLKEITLKLDILLS